VQAYDEGLKPFLGIDQKQIDAIVSDMNFFWAELEEVLNTPEDPLQKGKQINLLLVLFEPIAGFIQSDTTPHHRTLMRRVRVYL
jgi:hypothetical protein